MNINRTLLQILSGDAGSRTEVVDFFVLVRGLYNFFKARQYKEALQRTASSAAN